MPIRFPWMVLSVVAFALTGMVLLTWGLTTVSFLLGQIVTYILALCTYSYIMYTPDFRQSFFQRNSEGDWEAVILHGYEVFRKPAPDFKPELKLVDLASEETTEMNEVSNNANPTKKEDLEG